MKALVISHGQLNSIEWVIKEAQDSDIVVCADGGAEYAQRCGIIPDYLIGDFDSIPSETLEYYKALEVNFSEYPSEKDYTDTEICIIKAVELGADEVCIAAGIGNRLDHSLGNIGLLHQLNDRGKKGYIVCDDCTVYLCRNRQMDLTGEPGDIISIIPYGGNAQGVTLQGLKYPLNNATIALGQPIGISNVMNGYSCSISIRNGELLIIKQRNI